MKYIFILHIIAQVEYGHAWYGKFFCRIGQNLFYHIFPE